ncbi:MAG: flavodoxin domain-containing protein [Xanthomonadales bacterium]
MLNALKTENSPFSEQQIVQLRHSLGQLDPGQSAWLSGYLAGRLAGGSPAAVLAAPPSAAQRTGEQGVLNLFYASQTGNGEDLAQGFVSQAARAGLAVKSRSMNELKPALLKKLDYAVFIISTHGEGDPPDDALDLFEYLESARALQLETLRFRVLALGDRSYSLFCEAGRKLEELLLARGAKTFAERVDCDLDYRAPAGLWSAEVIEYGCEELMREESGAVLVPATIPAPHLSVVPSTAEWNRKRPFPAVVERVQKITALESDKDVYHVELSLQESGLRYEPGDSLGVWAVNDPELVAEVLAELAIDPATEVEAGGSVRTIREMLTRHRELTRLSADTIEAYAGQATGQALQGHFASLDNQQRKAFIEQRQFIDLVKEYPARPAAQTLAELLRPLTPRSYSIASSQASVDEEVHLTVATRYSDAIGQQRRGVASAYLNYRLQAGDEIGVFIEPNRRFRLPQDRSTPLILIAAGTGIAPYRAFLQQLEEEGASPQTWLIFGNPHLRTDFLYQREWLRWRKKGLLARIDGAFSRDHAEKRYVQHVVRDRAAEIDEWLNAGAQIYLCGSLAMGREVEQALQQGIARNRGLEDEVAAQVVAGLRRDRRLLKDLY